MAVTLCWKSEFKMMLTTKYFANVISCVSIKYLNLRIIKYKDYIMQKIYEK